METENMKDEIEIDIRGLLFAIRRKLAIIILVGIIFGGMAYAYSYYLITPKYVSTTQVYIVNKQNPDQTSLTTNDLTFATYITKDYQVLLTSDPVLEEVRDELELDVPTAALASMISVQLVEDTRIMKISVTSTNPKLAKAVADKVRDVANKKTKSVMGGIEAVNPVDEAKLPTVPTSPNIQKNTLLGFIGGFGIAVIIVVIMFILDDTIKTPEDIENKLGVSVLASIPLKKEESGSKKKKKKKKNKTKESQIEETDSKTEDK